MSVFQPIKLEHKMDVLQSRKSKQKQKAGYIVRAEDNIETTGRGPSNQEVMRKQSQRKLSQDSPQSTRSSTDSGVYTGDKESPYHSARHYDENSEYSSRPPSSRPSSSRRKSRQGYERAYSGTPSPVSRPTSATSFSSFKVLPDIGGSSRNASQCEFYEKTNQDSGNVYHCTESQRNNNVHKNLASDQENLNIQSSDLNHRKTQVQKDKVISKTNRSGKSQGECAIIKVPSDKLSERNDIIKIPENGKKQQNDGQNMPADGIESLFPPLKRKVALPPEPKDKDTCLLLAVKLPNGQRVQRHFKVTEKILHVIRFSEHSSKLDLTGCELVCDAPRKVFKDHNIKLSETKLESRTILHIQIPDN